MSTESEKTAEMEEMEKQIHTKMDRLDKVLYQWEKRLEDLEKVQEEIDSEDKESYQAEIEGLQERLNHLQVRLQAMREGDPKEWFEGRSPLRQKMEAFKEDLVKTAGRLKGEKQESGDWLEIFTEDDYLDSALWVAGVHHNPLSQSSPT